MNTCSSKNVMLLASQQANRLVTICSTEVPRNPGHLVQTDSRPGHLASDASCWGKPHIFLKRAVPHSIAVLSIVHSITWLPGSISWRALTYLQFFLIFPCTLMTLVSTNTQSTVHVLGLLYKVTMHALTKCLWPWTVGLGFPLTHEWVEWSMGSVETCVFTLSRVGG